MFRLLGLVEAAFPGLSTVVSLSTRCIGGVLPYSWTVNFQRGAAFSPQLCISMVLSKAKMTWPFGAAGTQAIIKQQKQLKGCECTLSSPKPAADIPFRDFSRIHLAQTAPF